MRLGTGLSYRDFICLFVRQMSLSQLPKLRLQFREACGPFIELRAAAAAEVEHLR